jgi:hypothetical protein
MTAVTQKCLDLGICPCLWDTGGMAGEISRQPPYAIRSTLKQVLTNLKR